MKTKERGWWERECLRCGLKDFDFKENRVVGGAWGGPKGEYIHVIDKYWRTENDCRGLVKEIWHGREN